MIPHSKVMLEEEDFADVVEVLRSGKLVQGSVVSSFEFEVAKFIGVKHAAAVNSGTSALHLSLIALGVGVGDEVILPSYVCTALLNAIRYVGANSVIVDIDPHTYNITSENIQASLTNKTKAIIVPHMFGLPADINSIISLGIPVIEDCAHSIGAMIENKCIGSFGDLSICSFYATKMLGAGEGGMVLSDDHHLIDIIRDLRSYDEKDVYQVRYNYKFTDIQAALCKSLLKKLPLLIKKRKEIAIIYNNRLKNAHVKIPVVLKGYDHIYYRYVVSTDNQSKFIEEMYKMNIECVKPVFKPLHKYSLESGYPATNSVWERSVSIPMYPNLSLKEVDLVVGAVKTLSMKGVI
jgi:dTDP-4-amino-4,6-dideoxygalactose transaminase